MTVNFLSLSELFPVSMKQAQVKTAIERFREILEETTHMKYDTLLTGLRHVSATVVYTKNLDDDILLRKHFEEPCDLYTDSEQLIRNINSFLAQYTDRILSPAEAEEADAALEKIKVGHDRHLEKITQQPCEFDLRQLRTLSTEDQMKKISNIPLIKTRRSLQSWDGFLYEVQLQVKSSSEFPARKSVTEMTFSR